MGMLKYYRLANLLSLDVVAGAVCCALFFCRLFSAEFNPAAFGALGLTVWAVYTVDHLRDSQDSRSAGITARRAFHKMHGRKIMAALAVCLVIIGVTLFWLPAFTLAAGGILLLPVTIYIFLQKKIWWLKEFLVSVLYTVGVMMPSANRVEFTGESTAVIGAFFLIAFINLLIFSWYDHDRDKAEGHFSAVTSLGRPATRALIWVLFVFAAMLLAWVGMTAPSMILATMLLLHLCIFLFEKAFSSGDRYRLFGEAIFLLPGIFVFFP